MAFYDLIQISDDDIHRAKQSFDYNKNYWDITGRIDMDKISHDNSILQAKYEKILSDPSKAKKQFSKAIMIGIFFFISSLFLGAYGFFFGIIFWILSIAYIYSYYYKISIDIIKSEIAQENGWLYSPNEDRSKWSYLKDYSNEIFEKGNKNQYVEDQFWGQVENGGKYYDFYSGVFSYDVETRNSKGRRNTTTYKRHFFAIKLDKSINARFFLYPENVFSKIGNFFTKKEINTESIEFNKTFAFKYDGNRGEKELDIVKLLSPSLQLKLLDLNTLKGNMNVLFSNDCVIFDFKGKILQKIETNFIKDPKLSEKDKQLVKNELEKLITLSKEIADSIN